MRCVNFEAFFLGPKGENAEFYGNLLQEMLKQHVDWRKAYHFDTGKNFITDEDKKLPDFVEAQDKIQNVLYSLQELLKKNQPFFSPRYIGHMNWEVMMASIVAFFSASLYNPNNVARAGSTGTTELELQVGMDFVNLFGYDPDQAWGHICAGGTIANMEALWIARNMKPIPLVMKRLVNKCITRKWLSAADLPKDVIEILDVDDHVLISNYSPIEILELKDNVIATLNQATGGGKENEIDEEFDNLCMQNQGLTWSVKKDRVDLGVVLMPQSKHYSFTKTMDLLGLGKKDIRYVPVDAGYKMDIAKLEKMLFNEKRPILAVVCVMGSTEESSVDSVDRVVELRRQLQKKTGKSFHIHIDAAYGGYARSLFLDENNRFMSKKGLHQKLKQLGIIDDKPERAQTGWPREDVFRAFKAMPEADTITVDPHKLGYVLYPAGGIAIKDKRMRDAIHAFAPYVFKKPEKGHPDVLIGAYILEGSKPGASAAAVWTAHRIMPLNITGYGKLIGETIDGAHALYNALESIKPISITPKIKVEVIPVGKPDLNIVNYAYNFVGNKSLDKMNKLTAFVANNIFGPDPLKNQTLLGKTFIVSSTNFSKHEYGDNPYVFLKKAGISRAEWDRIKGVEIIRSVIMSPYLTTDYVEDNYVNMYTDTIIKEMLSKKAEIEKIYNNE